MTQPDKEAKILELLEAYLSKIDRKDDDYNQIAQYLEKNDFRINIIQDALLLGIEELKELRNNTTSLDQEIKELRFNFQKQHRLIRYLYKGFMRNYQKKETQQEVLMHEILSLSERVSKLEGN